MTTLIDRKMLDSAMQFDIMYVVAEVHIVVHQQHHIADPTMIPPAGKQPSILWPMPIDQPTLASLGGTPGGNGPSIFVASASRGSVCGIGMGPEGLATLHAESGKKIDHAATQAA